MQRMLTLVLAVAVCVAGLLAQGPQFKSQEEVDAFMLLQQAQMASDSQSMAVAGSAFISQFPNSEAVALASYLTMLAHQQLNDFDNMLLYGEMVLDSKPVPGVLAGTLISLATAIPSRTREFDLDREEKLGKAEDYAKRAMAMIPALPKVDPNLTDDAWLENKKELMSQGHEAIGGVYLKRQDFPAAEDSLRRALALATQPVPFTLYGLAQALAKQNKKEEAAEFADRCIATGGLQGSDGSDLCAKLKSGL